MRSIDAPAYPWPARTRSDAASSRSRVSACCSARVKRAGRIVPHDGLLLRSTEIIAIPYDFQVTFSIYIRDVEARKKDHALVTRKSPRQSRSLGWRVETVRMIRQSGVVNQHRDDPTVERPRQGLRNVTPLLHREAQSWDLTA